MKALLRKIIVWALGGEPVIRQPDPLYDAAALDKIVREIQA